MIRKTGNIIILLSILGVLLFSNLTESRTYERTNNGHVELYRLDLTGKDFLSGKSSEEFELVESKEYSYSGFRNMVLILIGIIFLMFLISLFDQSILITPVSFSVLFILALFVGVGIAQYPNYFFEFSMEKFPFGSKTIDSTTPSLETMGRLAFGGLIFNWIIYWVNKKSKTTA